jgi:hypothetical protein
MMPYRLAYSPNISEELAVLYSWIRLKMEAEIFSEALTPIYQSTRRYILEDGNILQ